MPHRAFVLNNYPIERVRALARRGEASLAHAWGTDALASAGWDVRFAATVDTFRPHGGRFGGRYGDPHQQLGALRAGRGDLIYSADKYSCRALCMLRATGVGRAPTVVVFHHPQPVDRESRWMMRGVDLAICLSGELRQQLIDDFGFDPRRARGRALGSGSRSVGVGPAALIGVHPQQRQDAS